MPAPIRGEREVGKVLFTHNNSSISTSSLDAHAIALVQASIDAQPVAVSERPHTLPLRPLQNPIDCIEAFVEVFHRRAE